MNAVYIIIPPTKKGGGYTCTGVSRRLVGQAVGEMLCLKLLPLFSSYV